MKKIFLLIALMSMAFQLEGVSQNIISDLERVDSATMASVKVYADPMITDVVLKMNTDPTATLSRGWSVQVFSDNSQDAKDEAFKIENKIKEKLPYEYVRAERKAPFWKVRVGQFSSVEEARELRTLLLEQFPELKGGIYIVRFNNQ